VIHQQVVMRIIVNTTGLVSAGLVLFALLSGLVSAQPSKQLLLVYQNKPNPPFYLGEEQVDLVYPGATIEMLKRLQLRLPVNISFYRMPWVRALKLVEDNLMDGIFITHYRPERLAIGRFPMRAGQIDADRSLLSQNYHLYKPADSELQWDGDSFKQLKGQLAVINGYSIIGELKAMGVSVYPVIDQRSGLGMVAMDRVAGFIGVDSYIDPIIQAQPERFAEIKKVYPPIRSELGFLMFSHNFAAENPQLVVSIWDAIREMHASGEYQSIVEKYRALLERNYQ